LDPLGLFPSALLDMTQQQQQGCLNSGDASDSKVRCLAELPDLAQQLLGGPLASLQLQQQPPSSEYDCAALLLQPSVEHIAALVVQQQQQPPCIQQKQEPQQCSQQEQEQQHRNAGGTGTASATGVPHAAVRVLAASAGWQSGGENEAAGSVATAAAGVQQPLSALMLDAAALLV
jgi:hypothetical protein